MLRFLFCVDEETNDVYVTKIDDATLTELKKSKKEQIIELVAECVETGIFLTPYEIARKIPSTLDYVEQYLSWGVGIPVVDEYLQMKRQNMKRIGGKRRGPKRPARRVLKSAG